MKCYAWLVRAERSTLGSDHVVVASVYAEKIHLLANRKYITCEEQYIRCVSIYILRAQSSTSFKRLLMQMFFKDLKNDLADKLWRNKNVSLNGLIEELI